MKSTRLLAVLAALALVLAACTQATTDTTAEGDGATTAPGDGATTAPGESTTAA
jgi:predicted small secreted protein